MDIVDLADQAGAAADLDAQARGRFDMEMQFGDTQLAIGMAVLETRTPLPDTLLTEICSAAPNWYASDFYRSQVLDAVKRQQSAR